MQETTVNQYKTATDSTIRVEKNYSSIKVDKVEASKFKDKMLQAQLRQTVITKSFYPSQQIGNSLSDNLFSADKFTDIGEQEFLSTEERVAFQAVPLGTTVEEVMAELQKNPEARIYRILSNHPILTVEQENGIKKGLTTKDIIANAQVVRVPNTAKEDAGQILVDSKSGKVQYRRTFFAKTAKEDIDYRTMEPEDMYITPEIANELGSAVVLDKNQHI